MKVRDLRKYVVLNFRYPYIDSLYKTDTIKFEKYLKELDNLNVEYRYGSDSVQRPININKMKQVSKFIKEDNNFLPNSIILGCFKTDSSFTDDYNELLKQENKELDLYSLNLDSSFELTAIDGQHRLAGLFMSETKETDDLEIPIIVLFGTSLTISSKIFLDINANQKSVDKSLMYDLLPILDEDNVTERLKNKEIKSLKKCHKICVTFYKSPESPLFKQIRMLGTGTGSISQAFFVDQIYPFIHNGILENLEINDQFEVLLSYFQVIRKIFPEDWPVLAVDPFNTEHQELVLNYKKSQLPKTLGIGAWLKIFPTVLNTIGLEKENLESEIKYSNNKIELYKKIEDKLWKKLSKVRERIIWNESDYKETQKLNFSSGKRNQLPIYITGTNRVAINELAEEIKNLILNEN